jgi:hypothetical protein
MTCPPNDPSSESVSYYQRRRFWIRATSWLLIVGIPAIVIVRIIERVF